MVRHHVASTHVELLTLGRIRYANNSNYRNDSLIRKESGLNCSLVPLV